MEVVDRSFQDTAYSAGVSALSAGKAGETPPAAGSTDPAKQPAQRGCYKRARWMAVYHRVDDGARVRLGLRRAGYDVHWPREVVRLPRQDDRLRPFFAGYMFASAQDLHEPWQELRSKVRNLISIVGVREFGEPAYAPRGLVEGLIAMAGGAIDGIIQPREDVVDVWQAGTPVRIQSGAFEGVKCLVDADRGERVVILLELMGVMRRVTVRRDQVQVAE